MTDFEKMSSRDLLLKYADCHEHDHGDDDEYSELMRRLQVYDESIKPCFMVPRVRSVDTLGVDSPNGMDMLSAYCEVHHKFDCEGK